MKNHLHSTLAISKHEKNLVVNEIGFMDGQWYPLASQVQLYYKPTQTYKYAELAASTLILPLPVTREAGTSSEPPTLLKDTR